MALNSIALICANTSRTKAYLQVLCENNLMIEKCFIMSTEKNLLEQEATEYVPVISNNYFSVDEPLVYTLSKYNIEYEFIDATDINDSLVRSALQACPEEYIVYSGFGGQILRDELFTIGKKYIHVHAGLLPQYRGSTTIYYSILNESICGASSIFLNPKIDEGDILLSESFPIPEDRLSIDYIYDPWIRAQVLLKTLQQYSKNGKFSSEKQASTNENTYYIIHPVLKHIAILQK